MAQVNAGRVRFVSRGEYNNSTQYYLFDLVDYNGSSYFAKANTTGNVPTNTTYWQLIAEKGNTGDVGPTGPTGNGIASVTKTGTSGLVDTYTVTYTNGNTSTFTVTNGKGISSVTKVSTVGLVDTYRITFNDGTTTDYTVTNGEDGEVTEAHLQETVEPLEKHSEDVEKILDQLPQVSGSGSIITLDDVLEARFRKLFPIDGKSEQESTTGKNEMPPFVLNTQTINNVTLTSDSKGKITLSGTASADTNIYINMSEKYIIKANDYIHFMNNAGTFVLMGYNSQGSYNNVYLSVDSSNKILSLNSYENKEFAMARFVISNGTTINVTMTPMIVNNISSATDYEPYTGGQPAPSPDYPYPIKDVTGDNTISITNSDNTKSQSYLLSLGDIHLRGIGDCKDSIVGSPDNWKIKRMVRKIELAVSNMNNGDTFPGWRNVPYLHDDYPGIDKAFSQITSAICNITTNFIKVRINTTSIINNATLYLIADGFNNLTEAQWKEQYPDLVMELDYGLQEAYYETITNETLINQLNELYYANSYNGQTNVFVKSDDENAQLELNLSALADIGKLISNLQG